MKKFPVTTEDGREFRVAVSEYDHDWTGVSCCVKLYRENKRMWRIFRFRRVYERTFQRADGYDWKNPNYIGLVARSIEAYDDSILRDIELTLRVAKRNETIAEAHAAFSAWDGKITGGGGGGGGLDGK